MAVTQRFEELPICATIWSMQKPLRLVVIVSILFLLTSSHVYAEGYDSFSDRLHISGEAGAAFFDTGSEGLYPNNEFLVDEAKIFVEASITDDIYVFSEIGRAHV